MKKKLFVLALKIIIGAALVVFIVWKMAPGWESSKRVIGEFFSRDFGLFAAAFFCFGAVVCLGTYRWRMLLRAHMVRLSFPEAFKLFLIGHFFSQFMPGGLAGGDVIRSVYISAHTDERKHEAVTTVFIDRMTGIFGLFVILLAALLLNLSSYLDDPLVLFALIFLPAAAVAVLLFFNKALLRRIPGLDRVYEKLPFRDFLTRIYDAFHYYKDHKFVLCYALVLSAAVHLILATMVFFVGRGLGLETAYRKYLILVSMVNFVGSVPISPLGNVGPQEAGYLGFFGGEAGKDSGIPGALAIVIRILYYMWGLVGLVVWLFNKSRVSPEAVETTHEEKGTATVIGQEND